MEQSTVVRQIRIYKNTLYVLNTFLDAAKAKRMTSDVKDTKDKIERFTSLMNEWASEYEGDVDDIEVSDEDKIILAKRELESWTGKQEALLIDCRAMEKRKKLFQEHLATAKKDLTESEHIISWWTKEIERLKKIPGVDADIDGEVEEIESAG